MEVKMPDIHVFSLIYPYSMISSVLFAESVTTVPGPKISDAL